MFFDYKKKVFCFKYNKSSKPGGHMRTPKIKALHRMIEWFNTHDNCEIKPLGVDISPLNSLVSRSNRC